MSPRGAADDDDAPAGRRLPLFSGWSTHPVSSMPRYDIVARELPGVRLHEFVAGSECEDWVVRPSWRVIDGRLSDETGAVLAGVEESPLFVAPRRARERRRVVYEGRVATHIRTWPDMPGRTPSSTATPTTTRRRAGVFPCHTSAGSAPTDGRYHVLITGRACVDPHEGRGVLPSGAAAGRHLCVRPHRRTVQRRPQWLRGRHRAVPAGSNDAAPSILVPVIAGAGDDGVAVLCGAQRALAPPHGRYVEPGKRSALAGSGCSAQPPGQQPRRLALRVAVRDCGLPFGEVDFFHEYMDDERVYGWPSIGIPGVKLQRFPFAEYHTSADTPAIVSPAHLESALQVAETFTAILDRRRRSPETTKLLPPWLTRYTASTSIAQRIPKNFQKYNAISSASTAAAPWRSLPTRPTCGSIPRARLSGPIHRARVYSPAAGAAAPQRLRAAPADRGKGNMRGREHSGDWRQGARARGAPAAHPGDCPIRHGAPQHHAERVAMGVPPRPL